MAGRNSHAPDARNPKLAYMAVACLFLVLVVRLFDVQVVHHRHFERLALENQFRVKRVVAPRGLIKDRTNKSLVDNVAEYELYVDAAVLRGDTGLLPTLARDFGVDTLAARARWEAQRARGRGRGTLPVKVLAHLDKQQLSRFEENRDLYPGAQLRARGRRRYIYDDFSTHVLGYVGEVSQDHVDRSTGSRAYRLGDVYGRSGVEALCEDQLRGVDGSRRVQVNAAGQELFELAERAEPPVPGHDIHLTIDHDLQWAIEKDLWPEEYAGAVVVMDVWTGDLLAAVSKPGYDPNRFSVGISNTEYKTLRSDPLTPLFNRYANAGYPPGSTFKIVSSVALLEHGIVAQGQKLKPCFGGYRVGNRVFRCWNENGHGRLDLLHAFEQSCDVYYYQVARALGIDHIAQTARRFGFGRRTGFALPEDPGLIPDHTYYDKVYGERGWTWAVAVNCIIGQGEILVTPVQMARLVAAVANGGRLLQPKIVNRVVDARGRVLRRRETVVEKVDAFTPRELDFLRRAMLQVVIGERGTGHAALPESILVAGKTGTAETPGKEDDHAWFVFYAPFHDPQIAGVVIVELAGHGGSVAAPIARQIVSTYFGLQDRGPAYWRRYAELRATRSKAWRTP